MAIRFALASGLALTAALLVAAPARAQFFSFYEMAPRQIVGMLDDDGYHLRGPMIRRGDVYICDVTSISGRGARLIVSARDGQILERYASSPRYRDYDNSDDPHLRPPRDVGSDDDFLHPHRQMALGEPDDSPPSNVLRQASPEPAPDADVAPKPKRHAAKKHTAVAKAAPETPKPDESRPAEAPKPSDGGSVAAVAPNPPPAPAPSVEPVKPTPAPKAVEAKPVPAPAETRAEAEPKPAPAPAKTETHQKKINDLPVGTLD